MQALPENWDTLQRLVISRSATTHFMLQLLPTRLHSVKSDLTKELPLCDFYSHTSPTSPTVFRPEMIALGGDTSVPWTAKIMRYYAFRSRKWRS
jgi:hypothetical protein